MPVQVENKRLRRRMKAMMANVTGTRKRRIFLLLGDKAVKAFRINVLKERTVQGQSFKNTLAPSTQDAIRKRKLSKTRGRARKGKKLRTVVGGAHTRRGGATVLRDNGHMFGDIGIASVNSRGTEVGMTTKREAKKASGHHFHIKPHKGPMRRFIGINKRLFDDLLKIVEDKTVRAPGVQI